MLKEIFYWLFNMSIVATLTGMIVLLLCKIKKLPRRVTQTLWAIPMLRLLLPLGIGSKYSLMSLISKYTTKTVVVYEGSLTYTMSNSIMAANTYFPITYKINLLDHIFNIASVVWLVTAVIIMILFIVLYRATKKELRRATHLRDNIYVSERITSPVVYGVFKPRILLPIGFTDNNLEFILLHERMHIRNNDNLWRIIAFTTTILHWFNPFAWLFLQRFLAETELACDERVLSRCDEEEKKAYALVLVDCAESKNIFASAFGGARIKIRIERILSYKKISFISAIFFVALAVAIAYALLTNAL